MADTPPVAPESNDNGATQPPAGASDKGAQQPAAQPPKADEPQEVSLTKEQLEAAFKHPRFKELTEKVQRAETVLKEKASAEEAALKEQGKWKELAEKGTQEVERFKNSSITAEIKAYAAKVGAVDLNDVAALADKSSINIDESGNITGAEEAVKALVESKPHLFNNSNNTPPRVGSGTNPGDANNQGIPKFTHSQIKDPAFWQKNEKDILAALRAGQVVDDLAK